MITRMSFISGNGYTLTSLFTVDMFQQSVVNIEAANNEELQYARKLSILYQTPTKQLSITNAKTANTIFWFIIIQDRE